MEDIQEKIFQQTQLRPEMQYLSYNGYKIKSIRHRRGFENPQPKTSVLQSKIKSLIHQGQLQEGEYPQEKYFNYLKKYDLYLQNGTELILFSTTDLVRCNELFGLSLLSLPILKNDTLDSFKDRIACSFQVKHIDLRIGGSRVTSLQMIQTKDPSRKLYIFRSFSVVPCIISSLTPSINKHSVPLNSTIEIIYTIQSKITQVNLLQQSLENLEIELFEVFFFSFFLILMNFEPIHFFFF